MILYIIVWKKKVWWKNQFLVDFLHCLILKNVDDLACVGGTFWQARSTPVQLNLSWGTDLVLNPHMLQRLPLFVCERKREAWTEPFFLFDQSLTSLHSVNGSLCRSGEDLFSYTRKLTIGTWMDLCRFGCLSWNVSYVLVCQRASRNPEKLDYSRHNRETHPDHQH